MIICDFCKTKITKERFSGDFYSVRAKYHACEDCEKILGEKLQKAEEHIIQELTINPMDD